MLTLCAPGTAVGTIVIAAMWYGNSFSTAYLPINSNRVFDNTGNLYNVSLAVNEHALFDAEKYANYSPPFLTAGYLTEYMFFFSIYTATISYAYIYHRYEIATGFRNLFNSFRKDKDTEVGQYLDVHNRLMKKYAEVSGSKQDTTPIPILVYHHPYHMRHLNVCHQAKILIFGRGQVPEWWYTIVTVVAIAFGCAGIAAWETYTSPGVVFYGLALCAIFVIPVGIIKAMTGIEVTLNVLAEFIGGSFAEGNALSMNFFKSFGYVTCAHALFFSNDLKLAHYVKIPPRQTFSAQMWGTLVSTFGKRLLFPPICLAEYIAK